MHMTISVTPPEKNKGPDLANVGGVDDPPLYMYGVTGFEDQ